MVFDLGVPFGAFLIYAIVWVVGYFIWATRSMKKLEESTGASSDSSGANKDEREA